MKRSILAVLLLMTLFFPTLAMAEVMSFEEKYVYDASEADSKLSCRAISLLEVKKLLLERLGTFLKSSTEVVNLQLTRDEVTTLSAGVVKTEILEEHWDGRSYSLTARIEADPQEVSKLIEEFAKSDDGAEKIQQLEDINQEAIRKIELLKQEMSTVQDDLVNINRDYQKAAKVVDSWGAFENGVEMLRDEQYEEAIVNFNKAIELNPQYNHYLMRGKAYMSLKKYDEALVDFDLTLAMNPKVPEAKFQKGRVFMKKKKKREGLALIREAAKQGNGKARLWLEAKGK